MVNNFACLDSGHGIYFWKGKNPFHPAESNQIRFPKINRSKVGGRPVYRQIKGRLHRIQMIKKLTASYRGTNPASVVGRCKEFSRIVSPPIR